MNKFCLTEDDKEEALKNERHIKQTAMQLTLARKSSKLRTKLSTDLLLFYLSQLTKPEFENEYLDMRFVQDLLNEGSDLNYVNDNSENALFFVSHKTKIQTCLLYLKIFIFQGDSIRK